MPNTQSGINDDELNRMIASLQNNGHSATSSSSTQKVVQPPASQPAANPISDVNPVSEIFNQQPSTAKPSPEQPINSSAAGSDKGSKTTHAVTSGASTVSTPSADRLEDIKRQAITELRPLVDKLNLPPEDRFDTLLLLIRTTDDSSLIPAAHDAAKEIADESRRAQALLDVIKEIDFFGRK